MRDSAKRMLQTTGLLGWGFRLYERAKAADPRVLVRNARLWGKATPAGLPVPPPRLIVRATGTADVAGFLRGGELAVQSLQDILGRCGSDIADLEAILDFGCGCGRVIRHLRHLDGAELWGTDCDPELVDWCSQNLTFARFEKNHQSPPMAYEEERFDLVYALSVLTHLPEELQSPWMDELYRVLRKGGYLIMSTHGERYLDEMTTEEQQRFLAGELVVRFREMAGTNMCAAFHPRNYVCQKLAGDFRIVDFIPEGAEGNPHQDLFLMQK